MRARTILIILQPETLLLIVAAAATEMMQSKNYLPQNYKPLLFDIMCGRGAQFFKHPANIFFREVVARYLLRYATASSRLQKSNIVKEIICELRPRFAADAPTQFIRMDTLVDRWYVLNSVEVRQKVGQTLREMKTNLDPEKRKEVAEKRARNHKARQLRRTFKRTARDDSDTSMESSTNNESTATSGSLASLEAGERPVPCVICTSSLSIDQVTPPLPSAAKICRTNKSEGGVPLPTDGKPSLTPEEAALTDLPSTCSSDWFDVPSLSLEDADLTDSISSLFDEW